MERLPAVNLNPVKPLEIHFAGMNGGMDRMFVINVLSLTTGEGDESAISLCTKIHERLKSVAKTLIIHAHNMNQAKRRSLDGEP